MISTGPDMARLVAEMADLNSAGNLPAAESLIRDLERLRGMPCAGCGSPLCSHQVLMSIVMGFKNAPRCLPCLGAALECDPIRLRDSLFDLIRRRECYAGAWNWANRSIGQAENALPPALLNFQAKPFEASARDALESPLSMAQPAASWDAGDMGCGELVLELRLKMEALRPGEILQLRARDLAAPEDLPAWCRLTGQSLVRAEPPSYWIRRKD